MVMFDYNSNILHLFREQSAMTHNSKAFYFRTECLHSLSTTSCDTTPRSLSAMNV